MTPVDAWLGDVTPARNPGGRPAKDRSGRQRKLLCERCGFIAYASASAIERAGKPVCGCGEPMTLPNLRDRAVVEWDTLRRELEQLEPKAYNAAMRELGAADMVIPQRGPRRGGAERQRCRWDGGYCSRFASSGGYCKEHRRAA